MSDNTLSNYLPSVFKWSNSPDLQDPVLKTSFENIKFKSMPELHLIHCYGFGFQILNVQDPKNISTVYCTKDEPVKFIKYLPDPISGNDEWKQYRPLFAIVSYEQDTIPGKVRLFSLATKNFVRDFKLNGSD